MTRYIAYSAPFGATFQDVLVGSFAGSLATGEHILDLDVRNATNAPGSVIYHFYGVVNKPREGQGATSKSTVIGYNGTTLQGVIGSINGSFNVNDEIVSIGLGIAYDSAGAITDYSILAAKERGSSGFKPAIFGFEDANLFITLGSLAGSYGNQEIVNVADMDTAINKTTGSITKYVVIGGKQKESGIYDFEGTLKKRIFN